MSGGKYSHLGVPEKWNVVHSTTTDDPSCFVATKGEWTVSSASTQVTVTRETRDRDVLHIRSGERQSVVMSYNEKRGWTAVAHQKGTGEAQTFNLASGIPDEIAPFIEKAHDAITEANNTNRPGFAALKQLRDNILQKSHPATAAKSLPKPQATTVAAAVYTQPHISHHLTI